MQLWHHSIRQLPVPLLPLLYIPNSITVILSTINFLKSLNYPVSSISRTLRALLLALSLKLLSPVHVWHIHRHHLSTLAMLLIKCSGWLCQIVWDGYIPYVMSVRDSPTCPHLFLISTDCLLRKRTSLPLYCFCFPWCQSAWLAVIQLIT